MQAHRFFIIWLALTWGGWQAWGNPITPPALARQIIEAMQNGQAVNFSRANIDSNVLVLQAALPAYPKDADLRFALGSCYLQQHKPDAAQAVLGQAHALAPNDAQIGMTYILALKSDHQLLKARDAAREISFAHPESPQLEIMLATLDMAIQKYDDAVLVLRPLLAQAPANLAQQDRGVILYLAGNCYLHQGKRTNAIQTLESANKLFPHAATILCALAEATLKNGETARARDYLDQVLAINPRMSAALYYRGIMMERAGAPDKARQYFQACYNLGQRQLPDNGEDYYRMAEVCAKLNKPEEAKRYQATAAQMLYTSDAPWAVK